MKGLGNICNVLIDFVSFRDEAVGDVEGEAMGLEEEHFGADDDSEEAPQQEEQLDHGIKFVKIHTVTSADEIVDDLACYAYESQLLELASLVPPQECSKPNCKKPLQATTSKVGTAMHIKWVITSIQIALDESYKYVISVKFLKFYKCFILLF